MYGMEDGERIVGAELGCRNAKDLSDVVLVVEEPPFLLLPPLTKLSSSQDAFPPSNYTSLLRVCRWSSLRGVQWRLRASPTLDSCQIVLHAYFRRLGPSPHKIPLSEFYLAQFDRNSKRRALKVGPLGGAPASSPLSLRRRTTPLQRAMCRVTPPARPGCPGPPRSALDSLKAKPCSVFGDRSRTRNRLPDPWASPGNPAIEVARLLAFSGTPFEWRSQERGTRRDENACLPSSSPRRSLLLRQGSRLARTAKGPRGGEEDHAGSESNGYCRK